MRITYIKIFLQYLTIFELGWVSSEELSRLRRVLSDEAYMYGLVR